MPTRLSTIAIAAACLLAGAAQSLAQISIVFSPDGRGGVLVVGTGAGTTTNDSNGPVVDYDYGNADADFLVDALVDADEQVNTDRLVSGSLQNLSAGVSQPIARIGVDRDPTTADDIDIRLDEALAFDNGDEFVFSLVAGFTESRLSFDALIPGTYTILAGDDEDVIPNEEIFGNVTIVVVDEVLVGDFNDDAFVNAADFTLLRDTFGDTGDDLPADAITNGAIDSADYGAFVANFGGVAPGFLSSAANTGAVSSVSSAFATPEPSTASTIVIGLAAGLARRRSRASS